jgi:magnesium transporter
MEKIFFQNDCFTWYNLENPDEAAVNEYLQKFSLNPFTVQDSIEAGHLPKFEHHEDFDFILIRFFGKEKRSFANIVREFSHKIGIFIGDNFVLTVHQKPVPFWNEIKKELDDDKSKSKLIPKQLFYKICKKTIHSFMEPAQKVSEEIGDYEKLLFVKTREKVDLKKLYKLKRTSSTCSKILLLIQDVLNEYKNYVKSASSFKDLQDYTSKMLHLHMQNTDDLQNLFTLTLSISDQRANEVMKILTVFAAFFLPLSFIAGVYGMNFDYMPELRYKWSYFIVLGLMLSVVIVIFIWFKRKKYL